MASMLDKTLTAMLEVEHEHNSKIKDSLISAMDIALSQTQEQGRFLPLPAATRKTIVETLSGLWVSGARESEAVFEGEFKSANRRETKDEQSVLRLATRYVENYGSVRATQVITTTEKQIQSLIFGGLSRGEAASIVYADVSEKILDIAKTRADIITRTESHSVNQFVSNTLASRLGIPLKKTWNTNITEGTRRFGLGDRQDQFNHLVMNGTTIAVSDMFSVPKKTGGVERLLFPGDPTGSAGNVINCNCVQTYEGVG